MRLATFVTVALVTVGGCTARRPVGMETDGGTDAFNCAACVDTDNDLICDQQEGPGDPDLDNLENPMDLDDDGDGILDSVEAGDTERCTPPFDTDGDGIANFLDEDSDNDGLSDADELLRGTDPLLYDTDGDGFTDLAEVAAGTHPNDPASVIPADDYFVVLPYNDPAGHVFRSLEFNTSIQFADVFFLVDTTGSMGGSIAGVQAGLRDTIIPGVAAAIPSAWYGVAHYDDFPIGGYGAAGWDSGTLVHDTPFELIQEMTSDPATAQAAVDRLNTGNGNDGPESSTEALYQAITGEGLGSWVAPSPGCLEGAFGYPCFRRGALPIIVIVTDAPFHNGSPLGMSSGGGSSYSGIVPAPHTFDQAVAALVARHSYVVGLNADSLGWPAYTPRYDLEALARATGTVTAAGAPMVFDIPGGTGISAAIVDAIRQLANEVPIDVSAVAQDDPVYNMGVDARGFIKAIAPTSANPPGGITGMDAASSTFLGVRPGTLVTYTLDFYNDFVAPRRSAVVFKAVINVIGNMTTVLDSRNVYIVVPAGAIIFIE